MKPAMQNGQINVWIPGSVNAKHSPLQGSLRDNFVPQRGVGPAAPQKNKVILINKQNAPSFNDLVLLRALNGKMTIFNASPLINPTQNPLALENATHSPESAWPSLADPLLCQGSWGALAPSIGVLQNLCRRRFFLSWQWRKPQPPNHLCREPGFSHTRPKETGRVCITYPPLQ